MEVEDLSKKGTVSDFGRLAFSLGKESLGKSLDDLKVESTELDGIKFAVVKGKAMSGEPDAVKTYSVGVELDGRRFVFLAHKEHDGSLCVSVNMMTSLVRGKGTSEAQLASYSLGKGKLTKVLGGTYTFPAMDLATDKEKLDFLKSGGLTEVLKGIHPKD